MKTYSGAGLENFDGDDLQGALLVEKATIFENNVVVMFKSGIEVEV